MTDIEGFLTIYGHSDNLLNNNEQYLQYFLTLPFILLYKVDKILRCENSNNSLKAASSNLDLLGAKKKTP